MFHSEEKYFESVVSTQSLLNLMLQLVTMSHVAKKL